MAGQACEHAFVSGRASILHADLDSFYASVEQRDDPSLRGRPVIVGGGVVLAASYEAKARGIRTAMGGMKARRLCPQAIVVRPRMWAYSEASKAVFEIFRETSPLVEGLSIDEAFLDVRGLERIAGTPVEIATRLRREVLEQVGLPITVGVARTKFLAKVASARGQARRAAGRAPRPRAGIPAPARRRAAVGCRSRHRREAPRPRHRHRRAARRGDGDRARLDPRPGAGASPARPGPQPRSPPGRGRPAQAVDRRPARARPPPAFAASRSTRSSSGSSTG